MVWSDHSIVLLSLCNNSIKSQLSNWRLNKSILSDPIRVTELEKALKVYFLLNNLQGISAETLWAAHKATIWGKFIQIATPLKKLKKEFSSLRVQHKKDPSKVSISQLDTSCLALNLVLTVKAERSIRWGGAKFYQQSHKIGPMLASRLTPKPCSFTLTKIQLQDGSSTLNHLRIMHYFQAFYTKLYKANPDVDTSKINSFLDDLPLPTQGEGHRDKLEASITAEEVMKVIKNLRGCSARGPDGFSVPY